MYHLRFPSLAIRTAYINHMKKRLVSTVFHYQALHLSPIGIDKGRVNGLLPVTENAAETLVRLPIYRSMTAEETEIVLQATLDFST